MWNSKTTRYKIIRLLLILAACASVVVSPTPAPTPSPDEQAAYEHQMYTFVRGWHETTTEDKLAVCRDYFADREGVYEYLDEWFEGELVPRAFDDFFAGACTLEPMPTAERAG